MHELRKPIVRLDKDGLFLKAYDNFKILKLVDMPVVFYACIDWYGELFEGVEACRQLVEA